MVGEVDAVGENGGVAVGAEIFILRYYFSGLFVRDITALRHFDAPVEVFPPFPEQVVFPLQQGGAVPHLTLMADCRHRIPLYSRFLLEDCMNSGISVDPEVFDVG